VWTEEPLRGTFGTLAEERSVWRLGSRDLAGSEVGGDCRFSSFLSACWDDHALVCIVLKCLDETCLRTSCRGNGVKEARNWHCTQFHGRRLMVGGHTVRVTGGRRIFASCLRIVKAS
jgi:hypothetical protein